MSVPLFAVGVVGYVYCAVLFALRIYGRDRVTFVNPLELRRIPSTHIYRQGLLLLNIACAGLGLLLMGDSMIGGIVMLFQLFFMLSAVTLPHGWSVVAVCAVWANLYLATVLLFKMRRDVVEQGHAFKYVLRRRDASTSAS